MKLNDLGTQQMTSDDLTYIKEELKAIKINQEKIIRHFSIGNTPPVRSMEIAEMARRVVVEMKGKKRRVNKI